jgi:hypothetical protein
VSQTNKKDAQPCIKQKNNRAGSATPPLKQKMVMLTGGERKQQRILLPCLAFPSSEVGLSACFF